jgi:hypothetical protein
MIFLPVDRKTRHGTSIPTDRRASNVTQDQTNRNRLNLGSKALWLFSSRHQIVRKSSIMFSLFLQNHPFGAVHYGFTALHQPFLLHFVLFDAKVERNSMTRSGSKENEHFKAL